MDSLEYIEEVERKTAGNFSGNFSSQDLSRKLGEEISFSDGDVQLTLAGEGIREVTILSSQLEIPSCVTTLFNRLGGKRSSDITASWKPSSGKEEK